MKYAGDLITECREDTGNQSYSTNTGISDAKIIRALNYGLENLQGLILQTNPKLFQSEKVISIVANQEAYEIPDRVYLGTRIVNVEYSYTGQARDYVKIYDYSLVERNTYSKNYVYAYMRRNGQILLTPVPSSSQGTLRVTYERQVDSLALRAGVIDSLTYSGGVLSALSLDDASDTPTLIGTSGYFCVCDKDGLVKVYNVPYSAYNTSNGNFTLTSTAGETGQTPVTGDYVTIGKYSSSHVNMPDPCERYIKAYANWQLLGKDTATQAKAAYFITELEMIQKELQRSYQEADKDDHGVEIDNWGLILN